MLVITSFFKDCRLLLFLVNSLTYEERAMEAYLLSFSKLLINTQDFVDVDYSEDRRNFFGHGSNSGVFDWC